MPARRFPPLPLHAIIKLLGALDRSSSEVAFGSIYLPRVRGKRAARRVALWSLRGISSRARASQVGSRFPIRCWLKFRGGRFIDRDLDDAVRLALRELIQESAA